MARLLSTAGGYCQPQLEKVVDREQVSIIFLKARLIFNNKKSVLSGVLIEILDFTRNSEPETSNQQLVTFRGGENESAQKG